MHVAGWGCAPVTSRMRSSWFMVEVPGKSGLPPSSSPKMHPAATTNTHPQPHACTRVLALTSTHTEEGAALRAGAGQQSYGEAHYTCTPPFPPNIYTAEPGTGQGAGWHARAGEQRSAPADHVSTPYVYLVEPSRISGARYLRHARPPLKRIPHLCSMAARLRLPSQPENVSSLYTLT